MDTDYIVVGTGSAGSVVANRLSADPHLNVTVLEAGKRDTNPFIHIPATFAIKLFRSSVDWNYLTEKQPPLSDREIYYPRGKVLGGTSSTNAMMWVRGFAADYNEWGQLAGEEWDFEHISNDFNKIENGPLQLSHQRDPRSSTAAWLQAAREAGYSIEPPNQPTPQGFSETIVTQRRGARWSTADAYLKPALERKNLTLLTEAIVTRVLFDGTRATGVEYTHRGQRHVLRAHREVILCGGTINTPQLLMLSGIGDRQHLTQHGIPVIHHAPEVGKNLSDHLYAPLGFAVRGDTLSGANRPLQLLNYFLRRRGMLTSNGGEAYGFVRSRADLKLADLELMFLPAPYFDQGIGDPYPGHAITVGPVLLRPRSRGTITLRSNDPAEPPIIDPAYLSDDTDADRETLMAGLRITAEIIQQPALKNIIESIARPLDATALDESTLHRALDTCAHSIHHQVGTCRMGSDHASVVDPQLRVRGVGGLRIADASVMPTIIRGHTHAPTVLIGEKLSEAVLLTAKGNTPAVPITA